MKTAALSVVLAGSVSAQNIVELAQSVPTLSTLVDLVVTADLADILSNPNPAPDSNGDFTVFAPSNDAFAALPVGVTAFLGDATGGQALEDTLLYHVANGAALASNAALPTAQGATLDFVQDTSVNGNTIATPVDASNGEVFLLEAVLTDASLGLPSQDIPTLATSAGLSTLVDLVEIAGLDGVLSGDNSGAGFTVFAPTNEAFAALPVGTSAFLGDATGKDALTDTLLYHVVPSIAYSSGLATGPIGTVAGRDVDVTVTADGVDVNTANVETANVAATNGVVHVVDAILTDANIVAQLPSENIPTLATSAGLSTLVEFVVAAGLDGVLSGDNGGAGFTVFAPTNEAFAALPVGVTAFFTQDVGVTALDSVLLYHVVGAIAYSSGLSDGQDVGTLLVGSTVTVGATAEGVTINGASAMVDVPATNGVVHIVDQVLLDDVVTALLPLDDIPTVATDRGLTTLVDLVVAADLVETLSGDNGGAGFTVLAPSEEAFAVLDVGTVAFLTDVTGKDTLTTILLNHVVGSIAYSADLVAGSLPTLSGGSVDVDLSGGVFFDGQAVSAANVPASNGVVHVVDGLLLPSEGISDLPTGTIVDVAIESDLNALVEAVVTAGLDEVLSGDNDGNGFTVFAPLDSAFATLPESAVATEDVLLYHVVPSIYFSSTLNDGEIIETLNGGSLTVTINDSGVFVNGFAVVTLDVPTTNGVVHVIDGVLLPRRNDMTDDSLSGGAVAGVVIGCLCGVGLIAGAVLFSSRQGASRDEEDSHTYQEMAQ
jgi:transforming growth factor-beta-induced protein